MNRTVPVCLLMLLVAAAIPKTTKASDLRLGVHGRKRVPRWQRRLRHH